MEQQNDDSLDSSPFADIEITSNNLKSFAADLTLDDFNDEDLSEITEEKEIHQSFINGSFKCQKVKLSRNEISERMRRITADMVQLDLNSGNIIYEEAINGSYSELRNTTNKGVARPHTLTLFSVPCPSKRGGNKKRRFKFPDLSQKPDFHLHSNLSESNGQCSEKWRRDRQNYEEIEGENKDEVIRASMLTRSASEWSIEDPDDTEYCYIDGEMKKQTHTAQFKFIPRHDDEMELDMNDPLYISQQDDDFWCKGINMRTGARGICPSYYVQSVDDDFDSCIEPGGESGDRYFLYFLGSLEVPCHKGNDVLCQAMHKVAEARRHNLHSNPPAFVCLIVTANGIKMIDQSDLKKQKNNKSQNKKHSFSSSFKVKQQTHFFQMKNVSFCGHHPTNSKYFGFITRHPTQLRYACHTFVSDRPTTDVAESMGTAFSKFYNDYLEYFHPTEDFYME